MSIINILNCKTVFYSLCYKNTILALETGFTECYEKNYVVIARDGQTVWTLVLEIYMK
jgi:hypothetical protein